MADTSMIEAAHEDAVREGIAIGYTIATGRLFCDMAEFHAHAEKILGRPILTHEFADERTWADLRTEFEASVFRRIGASVNSPPGSSR